MAKKKKPQQKKAVSKTPVKQDSTPAEQDSLYQLLDSKIEIPLSNLRNKHIFIATPCYGGQLGEPYFRSMMRFVILCGKYNIQYTVSTLANESLITRGRNTLTSFFMENEAATHLFFIDADIEFNPEDILRMVAYDKPITVGANLVKLKDGGTGFMCIRKDVIQQMFDKHSDLKYVNDINVDNKFEPFMYSLFDCIIDPESRRYLSEDYTFCRRWQDMGGDVFLDPRTALNHVGHYTFRGNIRKLFTGENSHRRKQEAG